MISSVLHFSQGDEDWSLGQKKIRLRITGMDKKSKHRRTKRLRCSKRRCSTVRVLATIRGTGRARTWTIRVSGEKPFILERRVMNLKKLKCRLWRPREINMTHTRWPNLISITPGFHRKSRCTRWVKANFRLGFYFIGSIISQLR